MSKAPTESSKSRTPKTVLTNSTLTKLITSCRAKYRAVEKEVIDSSLAIGDVLKLLARHSRELDSIKLKLSELEKENTELASKLNKKAVDISVLRARIALLEGRVSNTTYTPFASKNPFEQK